MAVKFSYEKVEKGYFGQVYRPVAKVSFKSLKENLWTDTWMVVDTGADFSILPNYLTNDLGISVEQDCVKNTMLGVGGEKAIYLCKYKIEAKIGNLSRKVPIAFFDSNEIPALLGRLGFMETFDTTFLKTHEVVFKG